MPKSLDSGLQQKVREIKIEKSPLLKELFAVQVGDEVKYQLEIEGRFRPLRFLSIEELCKLSESSPVPVRHMEQCYVPVVDANGKKEKVRFRKTSPEPDGNLLRIAHKAKIEGHPTWRGESQINFLESDPRRREFDQLWDKRKGDILEKTRYYINHRLPNGHDCVIHYDIHIGGRCDGFVRIEVEFEREEDETYVRDRHWRGQVLPDWVGDDVSDIKAYHSSELAKRGPPEVYFGA